jgi:hypothetical protein
MEEGAFKLRLRVNKTRRISTVNCILIMDVLFRVQIPDNGVCLCQSSSALMTVCSS